MLPSRGPTGFFPGCRARAYVLPTKGIWGLFHMITVKRMCVTETSGSTLGDCPTFSVHLKQQAALTGLPHRASAFPKENSLIAFSIPPDSRDCFSLLREKYFGSELVGFVTPEGKTCVLHKYTWKTRPQRNVQMHQKLNQTEAAWICPSGLCDLGQIK